VNGNPRGFTPLDGHAAFRARRTVRVGGHFHCALRNMRTMRTVPAIHAMLALPSIIRAACIVPTIRKAGTGQEAVCAH
jgi:hypothetical protein